MKNKQLNTKMTKGEFDRIVQFNQERFHGTLKLSDLGLLLIRVGMEAIEKKESVEKKESNLLEECQKRNTDLQSRIDQASALLAGSK